MGPRGCPRWEACQDTPEPWRRPSLGSPIAWHRRCAPPKPPQGASKARPTPSTLMVIRGFESPGLCLHRHCFTQAYVPLSSDELDLLLPHNIHLEDINGQAPKHVLSHWRHHCLECGKLHSHPSVVGSCKPYSLVQGPYGMAPTMVEHNSNSLGHSRVSSSTKCSHCPYASSHRRSVAATLSTKLRIFASIASRA
jgi:hypothetical protein